MKKQLKNFMRTLANNARAKNTSEALQLANSIETIIEELESMEPESVTPEALEVLKQKIEALEAAMAKPEEIENKLHALKLELKNELSGGKGIRNAYLDSRQATLDFINSIVGAGNGKKASERWGDKLIKNGVSGLAFPTEIISGIFTKWEELNDLLTYIPKVSRVECSLVYTAQDQFTLDLFAKGHVKGQSKVPSTLTLNNKKINLQFAYVDQVIDRIDLVKLGEGSNNDLLKFVIEQGAIKLRESIIYTILFGNANQTTADHKITTMESIANKAQTDAFTVVGTTTQSKTLMEDIVELLDSLKNGKYWLYTSKANLTALRKYIHATGGTPQFHPISVMADMVGVERIETLPMPHGIQAVLIDPREYRLAGGDMFGEDWTIYEKNQEAFRSEIAIGGAIGGLLSTAVLKSA